MPFQVEMIQDGIVQGEEIAPDGAYYSYYDFLDPDSLGFIVATASIPEYCGKLTIHCSKVADYVDEARQFMWSPVMSNLIPFATQDEYLVAFGDEGEECEVLVTDVNYEPSVLVFTLLAENM